MMYNYDFLTLEVNYLRQYFCTIFLLFWLGLPYIAVLYLIVNAALWLGYEDDPDEEEIFDNDLEGDEDHLYEEYLWEQHIHLFLGLPEPDDESDVNSNIDIVLYSKDFDKHNYYTLKYINLFNSNDNNGPCGISFFYSLVEWNSFLSKNFGNSFLNLVCEELENSIISNDKFVSKFKNDSLIFPSKYGTDQKFNISEYYDNESDSYSDPNDSFFLMLFYKFSVLKKSLDSKFVYDLILADLNDYYFYLQKNENNDRFFSNLLIFKKKMLEHNFNFFFDDSSLKFVPDFEGSFKIISNKVDYMEDHRVLNKLTRRNKLRISKYWRSYKKNYNGKNIYDFNKLFILSKKRPNILINDPKLVSHLDNISDALIFERREQKKLKLQKQKENMQKLLRKKRNKKNIIFTQAEKIRLTLARGRTSYLRFKRAQDPNYDLKMKFERNTFLNSFYDFIDKIFTNTVSDKKSEEFPGIPSLETMNDPLISIINRKIVNHNVESLFLQSILRYKPLSKDLINFDKSDPAFFDLISNRNFKKLIEKNLDAFIKVSYKDFVLSGACSYEQLWFSLGYYSPLITSLLSKKIFMVLQKKKKNR